jgi:hypothetical protein
VLLEEQQHAVVEQIGRRDGRLAVVELGKAYLGVGVEPFRVAAADPTQARCAQLPNSKR